MKKWKISFFVTLLALLATNTIWLYKAIDAGVTYTYQQVSLDDKSKTVEMLGKLIAKGGNEYSKKTSFIFYVKPIKKLSLSKKKT